MLFKVSDASSGLQEPSRRLLKSRLVDRCSGCLVDDLEQSLLVAVGEFGQLALAEDPQGESLGSHFLHFGGCPAVRSYLFDCGHRVRLARYSLRALPPADTVADPVAHRDQAEVRVVV